MDFNELAKLVAKLGVLRYFPADADARLMICQKLGSMASDIDQIRWLVFRMPDLYAEWPGLVEARALFCSRFRPADGIEAFSEVYPEGIPSQQQPETRLLAAPGEVRMPVTVAELLTEAARTAKAPVCGLPRKALPPVLNPITAADIRRAEEEVREQKLREAREELS